MKIVAILLTVLMLSVLGLLTRAASSAAIGASNQLQGTPFFLPHMHKGFAATPTPTVNPTRLPDLKPEFGGIIYESTCPWGSPGRVWGIIRNSGASDSGTFSVLFNYTLIPIQGLAASATEMVSFFFESGPVAYVLIVADHAEEVSESDETNNRFELMFTPPLPCTATPTITPSPT